MQRNESSKELYPATCVGNYLGLDTEPIQYTLSLPVYVGGYENIQGIQVKFFDLEGNPLNGCLDPLADCGVLIAKGSTGDLSHDKGSPPAGCTNGSAVDTYSFTSYFDANSDSVHNSADGGDGISRAASWCIHDDDTGRQVLKVVFNRYLTFSSEPWIYASIRIEFNPIGTASWVGNINERQSLLPGNDLYYLSKLGRLELLGIPQITYEPIYCNNNYDELIPDLYDESLYAVNGDDRALLQTSSDVYHYSPNRHRQRDSSGTIIGNARRPENMYDEGHADTDATKILDPTPQDGRFMYADMIDQDPIFSAHEFSCCRGLGQRTLSAGDCCSGFAPLVSFGENEAQICKLPKGTNLNVYFNRFVSNEGRGENQPAGGLQDSDFIPETGEVKFNVYTYSKLTALGRTYCDNGSTTRGALFGYYASSPVMLDRGGEGAKHPTGTFRYSMADEPADYDDENVPIGDGELAGERRFKAGLHWDHHIYCGLGEE